MNGILLLFSGFDAGPWAHRFTELEPGRPVRIWPDLGEPADIGYACVWKPPSGALDHLPNLKVLFSLGAGVDHLLDGRKLPDVPIVRVVDPDLTARMSGYVVLHVLLHHRRLLRTLADQRAARWIQHIDPPSHAVRVGIMGLGELGLDAARKLAPFGFRLAGWSRSRKQVDGMETFAGDDELGAFLARTDILVALVPLTPATRGMIDRRLLAGLARDGVFGAPVLINVGRGGLHVEADIIAALADGTLSGASLDVFETEPLPPQSPLWTHPNVVVTPHVAALSDPEALTGYMVRQIRGFEAGHGLSYLVDRERGY